MIDASSPTHVHPFTLERHPDCQGTEWSGHSGHVQAVFENQGSEEQHRCSRLELNTQFYSPLAPKQIKPSATGLVFEKYLF